MVQSKLHLDRSKAKGTAIQNCEILKITLSFELILQTLLTIFQGQFIQKYKI